MNKSTLGAPGMDFASFFKKNGEPFWHRISDFFWNGQNHEFIAQGIVFEGFCIQKPLIFHPFFHTFFIFFRNPFWKAFLVPKMPIYAPKVDFWSTFGFPRVPKCFGQLLGSRYWPTMFWIFVFLKYYQKCFVFFFWILKKLKLVKTFFENLNIRKSNSKHFCLLWSKRLRLKTRTDPWMETVSIKL